MENFKCIECEKRFKTLKGLSGHRLQKHNILPKTTYNDYMLNGGTKLCDCGCGNETKFLSITKGYRDFIRGHSQRIHNNWGHNKSALMKSYKTQKIMHENGELTIWNKGLSKEDPRVLDNITKVMNNPNRGKNISKKLSGVPKSKEHIEKISKAAINRWSDPKEREKQANRVISRLIKNNYRNPKTKLESKFEEVLNLLDIKYTYQYPLESKMFDFFLDDYKILIEVDGDFHHCNPNSKHHTPKYDIQKNTIKNDKVKNNIAKSNNIVLLRFWESDINNDLIKVIKKLKNL